MVLSDEDEDEFIANCGPPDDSDDDSDVESIADGNTVDNGDDSPANNELGTGELMLYLYLSRINA